MILSRRGFLGTLLSAAGRMILSRRGFLGTLLSAAVSAVVRFTPLTKVVELTGADVVPPPVVATASRGMTAASWFAAIDPHRTENFEASVAKWQARIDAGPAGLGLARPTQPRGRPSTFAEASRSWDRR